MSESRDLSPAGGHMTQSSTPAGLLMSLLSRILQLKQHVERERQCETRPAEGASVLCPQALGRPHPAVEGCQEETEEKWVWR